MKAIILARVSTEEQITEGQSIPAQLAKAREYAKIKSLQIASEYQFDESSLKDHRTKFEQVIEEIKKSKEKVALVVETVDRLQRSFKESVSLDEFRKAGKLEIHFIRENLVIHKDSNSSEIQRWDLAVFIAKSYVLQISDNVKRTNEHKIRQGEWLGKAPIGFMNQTDGKNKIIIPDPARSHLIVIMFELYATGNYSIKTLTNKINEMGLKSNTAVPQPLYTSIVFHILKNPFYYGEMLIKGKLYPHKYQPLISRELFDRVQRVMLAYHRKPFKFAAKPFSLRGMVKCATCGCMVTPESHKGHTYYSCTNHRKAHDKRAYIREETLLKPIYEVTAKFKQLTDEKIQEIVEGLKKANNAKNYFHKQSLAGLRAEYDTIDGKTKRLLDLLIERGITSDIYNQKLKEFKEKQAEIIGQMQNYTDADETFYLTAGRLLSVAQRADEILKSSEPTEKRQFINFVFQNLRLDGQNLKFELKTPFDTVLLATNSSNSASGLRR